MANKKRVPVVAAANKGRVIATCKVPRGTVLHAAEVDGARRRVLFEFRVRWWAVLWYIASALKNTIRDGMYLSVWVDQDTNTLDIPLETIELTEDMIVEEPTVH